METATLTPVTTTEEPVAECENCYTLVIEHEWGYKHADPDLCKNCYENPTATNCAHDSCDDPTPTRCDKELQDDLPHWSGTYAMIGSHYCAVCYEIEWQ